MRRLLPALLGTLALCGCDRGPTFDRSEPTRSSQANSLSESIPEGAGGTPDNRPSPRTVGANVRAQAAAPPPPAGVNQSLR